ncbi:family 16 glycoside hydrolase [Fibrobacterota bacterium]
MRAINFFSFVTAFTVCSIALFAGTLVWDFEDVELGAIPDGWQAMSGESSPSGAAVTTDGSATVTWEAIEDATAPDATDENRVMAVTGHSGSVYEHGHHCWTDEIEFSDGTLEVYLVGRDTERGHMGVSFRISDHNTFYAVRLQAANGDLQTIDVKDGNIEYRTSSVATGFEGPDTWHKLTVEVAGNNIIVSVDDEQFIDYTDETDPITESGGVGLFSRGDVSIVSFDDFSVTADNIVAVKPRPGMFFKQRGGRNSPIMAIYDARGRFLGIGNSVVYQIPAPGVFFISEKGSKEYFKQVHGK